MHAILATAGTDGDVIPYLGLGAKLRRRGHRVTLAAPETYGSHAADLGLEFQPVVPAEAVRKMLADPDLWHPLRSGRMMAQWGLQFIPAQYRLLSEVCRGHDSVLVANPGILAARMVQEKHGCPFATLLLQPGIIPSVNEPPTMTAGLTLPKGLPWPLGPAYWMMIDAAGYLLVARAFNRIRADVGLAPIRRLFRWWLSPQLVIGMFPDWYGNPPPDWPAQIRLAGFGRYDGGKTASLSEDVREFCASGKPPIAFTLGTGMTHAAAFFRLAVAVCNSLGARGLLLTKYSHQIPRELPPTVRHCPFAPFRVLLPLCAALVHHGGVGTTAAALSAGTPQLVLPLAWDQPDNAARVQKLGVGDHLGPRRRSVRALARSLAGIMTEKTRSNCETMARRIGTHDGLETAADWVQELAAGRSIWTQTERTTYCWSR